jgi:5-methyltetrahydrofolate--homocysteine methyltransferase
MGALSGRCTLSSAQERHSCSSGLPFDSGKAFACAQETGVSDYLGLFANAAFGLEPVVAKYKAAGDDYSYIMAEALADRCAP